MEENGYQLDQSIFFEKCQTHPKKRLDQICIDESCQKRGLMCNLCAYQEHSNHKESWVPFEMFIESLRQQSTQFQMKDLFYKEKQEYQNSCDEMKMQLEDFFRLYENYFERQKQILNDQKSRLNTLLNSKTKDTRCYLQKLFNKSKQDSPSFIISHLLGIIKSKIQTEGQDKIPTLQFELLQINEARDIIKEELNSLNEQKQKLIENMNCMRSLIELLPHQIQSSSSSYIYQSISQLEKYISKKPPIIPKFDTDYQSFSVSMDKENYHDSNSKKLTVRKSFATNQSIDYKDDQYILQNIQEGNDLKEISQIINNYNQQQSQIEGLIEVGSLQSIQELIATCKNSEVQFVKVKLERQKDPQWFESVLHNLQELKIQYELRLSLQKIHLTDQEVIGIKEMLESKKHLKSIQLSLDNGSYMQSSLLNLLGVLQKFTQLEILGLSFTKGLISNDYIEKIKLLFKNCETVEIE